MLDEQGIAHNASTKLVTKIVRLVFGDCGRRAYVYARVIGVAHATKTDKISLPSFIANAGGIDEIRRTNGGVTPSQRKRVHAEHADRYFDTSSALIEPIRLIDQLQPSSEAGNDYAVALVRRNTDGTGSIVYGTANPALVRSVLAVAGAAIKSAADIAAADAAKALADHKKSEAIAAIAAA